MNTTTTQPTADRRAPEFPSNPYVGVRSLVPAWAAVPAMLALVTGLALLALSSIAAPATIELAPEAMTGTVTA